jgi:hypothetical protein
MKLMMLFDSFVVVFICSVYGFSSGSNFGFRRRRDGVVAALSVQKDRRKHEAAAAHEAAALGRAAVPRHRGGHQNGGRSRKRLHNVVRVPVHEKERERARSKK